MLKQIEFVTNGSVYNEALTRAKINDILISCIAEEKKLALVDQCIMHIPSASSNRPTTPNIEPAPLLLQFETKLSFRVTYKEEQRLLHGLADYSLWYDVDESMATNLVVVETRREGLLRQAEGQVTAYMGEQFTTTGITGFLTLITERDGTS